MRPAGDEEDGERDTERAQLVHPQVYTASAARGRHLTPPSPRGGLSFARAASFRELLRTSFTRLHYSAALTVYYVTIIIANVSMLLWVRARPPPPAARSSSRRFAAPQLVVAHGHVCVPPAPPSPPADHPRSPLP